MPETTLASNGFSRWEKYILLSIEELKEQHNISEDKIDKNREKFIEAVNGLAITVTEEVGELKSEIRVMKSRMTHRAAMWGVFAGSIPAAIALIITLLKLA